MIEDNAKSAVWFLAGAAIGAAIALLYAPAAGHETRRKISNKASEHKDKIVESGKDLMERGRDLYEKGRKMAGEATDVFEAGRKLVDH
jgi:gas vesicle protein